MADVNWNLAVTPDPFKQIAEGRDYSRSVFDQAALLKAGSQYAAGDPASAANTVASRGDFKTAGDLSTLATRRQAGQLYAGGDAAGAGKALAGGGDFETAGKLQEQQIKQIEAQQDAMGRTGSFLTAALADPNLAQNPNLPQQAWSLARQQLAAAQIPPERIAEFEKMFAADPKKAAAIMSHIATEVKVTSDGQGTLYLTDKYGNVVNKLGEDTLFGNTAEGKALGIVAKGPGAPNFDLARAFLERQQPSQIVDGHIVQGSSFTLPASILGGSANAQNTPPPVGGIPNAPSGSAPAPGTTGTGTQIGNKTIYDLPTSNKPLPPTVEKEEHDDIQAIFAAGNVAKDMKPFRDLLTSGKLTLGPIANAISVGRNWSGYSNEGSRGYDTMMNALLKMRDATLLLQKGTQTDGDARRAWDAILSSPNDVNLVNDRLELISELNDRAVQEHHLQIDLRRRNNNLEPYDWRGFTIPESPYAQRPPPDTAGRTVPRPPPVTSAPLRAPRAQAKPKYKIERVED